MAESKINREEYEDSVSLLLHCVKGHSLGRSTWVPTDEAKETYLFVLLACHEGSPVPLPTNSMVKLDESLRTACLNVVRGWVEHLWGPSGVEESLFGKSKFVFRDLMDEYYCLIEGYFEKNYEDGVLYFPTREEQNNVFSYYTQPGRYST